jgi:hypothetical protein
MYNILTVIVIEYGSYPVLSKHQNLIFRKGKIKGQELSEPGRIVTLERKVHIAHFHRQTLVTVMQMYSFTNLFFRGYIVFVLVRV